MKEKILVSNIPIGVRTKYSKPGIYLAPVYISILSKIFDITGKLSLNILDSYDDREMYLEKYIDNTKKLSLEFDEFIIDKQLVSQGVNIIDKLYNKGFIKEKEKEIYICKCGKIEFSNEAQIENTKLFKKESNDVKCCLCNSKCEKVVKKSLVFKIVPDIELPYIYPKSQIRDFEGLYKKFSNAEILISKSRNTGISYNKGNCSYNIDIEFLNLCVVAGENFENKILISSTYTKFHQLMTYLIHYYLFETKSVILLFTSYIINMDNSKERHLSNDKATLNFDFDIYLVLLMLFSSSWKKSESKWKEDYYKSLKYFSKEKLQSSMDLMIESINKLYSNKISESHNKINDEFFRDLIEVLSYISNTDLKKIVKEMC